jgi:uncharacterized Rmd1/YagE family protein
MTQHRDAYQIPMMSGICWVFNYGVIVAWGVENHDLKALYDSLITLIDEPRPFAVLEQYDWQFNPDGPFRINHDHIQSDDDSTLVKLALSHAFAQSTKLISLEDSAQKVITDNAYIVKDLAKTGKVGLNRRELAQLRGTLFETTSNISLNYSLLDTPEFFWDYPELEESYQRLAKYLDLQPRIEILTKKLSTIQSLLSMLAEEQNHKHSAFLEWIIIVLIAIDILIYFFEP